MDFKKPASIVPSSNISERISQIAYALNVLGFVKTQQKSGADCFKAASELTGFSAKDLQAWSEHLNLLPEGILRFRGAALTNPEPKGLAIDLLSGPGQIGFAKATCELLQQVYQGLMPELGKKVASQKRVDALLKDFQSIWISGTYLTVGTDSLPIAKRWLWFLESLNIGEAALFAHTATIGKDLPSATRQREYWKSGLGVNEINDSGKQINKSARGRIQIDLDLGLIPEKTRKINFQKVTVLYGVRATLALLAISKTKKDRLLATM